jgi:Type ISP C-terminal specificity domain/N-6 DNA Methylase
MSECTSIHEALQSFAASVTAKMTQPTPAKPEDQLRGPFENFMADVARVLGWKVLCKGEAYLPGRLGCPDYAVHRNRLLAGYAELKAAGVGATTVRFKGHDREQFRRFSALPNILYTDGNEWALYRDGELVDRVIHLAGDVAADGRKAATHQDAEALESLLRDFFSWKPFIPTDRSGNIDLKGFAEVLAPLCRKLREDVTDALKDPDSPLVQLAKDWRQLLFPEASDKQFADGYAQTVTFALLLGRGEGAEPLTLESAEAALAAEHSLLSRALQVLTDPGARAEMVASLDVLLRVIGVVPLTALTGSEEPWLYFYEDFLAAYDPELRKDAGVYYTPVEVVRCQVRLIDNLLANRLGRPLGFADPGVVTLDPGVGSGTYLLGVIEHALGRVEAEEGKGAVAGQATTLAHNLHGFEIMVGPYAVTELRVNQALRDRGAGLPKDGIHVYLTDTLESPHTVPPQPPLILRPIAEQHFKALHVKSKVPVIVCLGNPPYDRHEAASSDNKARTGSWVRWGDDGKGNRIIQVEDGHPLTVPAIFHDFLDPAIAAGHGVRVHNLYNLYVYFWRWAVWKVFEHEAAHGPGIVSFISASSYLDGDAFCGMREHMRRVCDEIWLLDLGGEGRGTRKDENVFAIQTPVAIAVAFRRGAANRGQPAKVRYARIEGTREEKRAALGSITDFKSVKWQDCPEDWQAAFRPAGKGNYFAWPLLTDLMPWQQSGVKAGRTWVIAPDEETLRKRWRALLRVEGTERKRVFKESPTGRKVHESAKQLPPSETKLRRISELAKGNQPPSIMRYGYRSFDRQWIFADARLLDRPSPELWRAHGERQMYLTTLLNHPLGRGPAVTACAFIADLHHFRGSYGAKETLPLYRTADGSETNILPSLLDLLGETYHRRVTSEDFLSYVYGALAQPTFVSHFHKELETRELRVPITKDAALFENVCSIGARLLWLHTYGERFIPKGWRKGYVPRGAAKCTRAISGNPDGYPQSFEYHDTTKTLLVGEGEFSPVAPEVFEFEVSCLKVVQSWLKYRMKAGAGKKSSPLDGIRPDCWISQFTSELLELLWVLEATVATYPDQAKLLEAVVSGDCFQAEELPPVMEVMRKPPKAQAQDISVFDFHRRT